MRSSRMGKSLQTAKQSIGNYEQSPGSKDGVRNNSRYVKDYREGDDAKKQQHEIMEMSSMTTNKQTNMTRPTSNNDNQRVTIEALSLIKGQQEEMDMAGGEYEMRPNMVTSSGRATKQHGKDYAETRLQTSNPGTREIAGPRGTFNMHRTTNQFFSPNNRKSQYQSQVRHDSSLQKRGN